METRFLEPQAGEQFQMMGITMTVKQDAGRSNGLLSIIEQEVTPGAGSPLHSCSKEDKIIYVLEGQFQIQIDDQSQVASAGATAIIGKGVPHNFKNIGTENGKVLVILTPGGHEIFLKDLSSTVQQHGRDKANLTAVAKNHQVTIF